MVYNHLKYEQLRYFLTRNRVTFSGKTIQVGTCDLLTHRPTTTLMLFFLYTDYIHDYIKHYVKAGDIQGKRLPNLLNLYIGT